MKDIFGVNIVHAGKEVSGEISGSDRSKFVNADESQSKPGEFSAILEGNRAAEQSYVGLCIICQAKEGLDLGDTSVTISSLTGDSNFPTTNGARDIKLNSTSVRLKGRRAVFSYIPTAEQSGGSVAPVMLKAQRSIYADATGGIKDAGQSDIEVTVFSTLLQSVSVIFLGTDAIDQLAQQMN